MLVYGDRARTADPREAVAEVRRRLTRVIALPPGIERHGALTTVFITAGKLTQGLADAEFEARGCDAPSAAQDGAMALLVGLARAVLRSWDSAFADAACPASELLDALAACSLPDQVRLKRPEGFAFYAIYPEAYAEAARASGLGPDTKVIGLRSIGAPLAAMVATALGAEDPTTLRPIGDPFRRELRVSEARLDRLFQDADAAFAIVDEGPGLSGSSLCATADLLIENGVSPDRLAFFPSHNGGLGPRASEAHKALWASSRRYVVGFDRLVLRNADPKRRLESWAADLIGKPIGPIEDVSGGAWRARRFESETEWPPVNSFQERRKFLLRTESGTWLLKFAGLGREAERKLDRARALATAGFTPEPAGLRHGFLVERWIEPAQPSPRLPMQDLVARLAAYLGFRARMLPAAEPGAALAELLDMARTNVAEALDEQRARALDRWRPRLSALQARVLAVETDNRLHAFEWLMDGTGRLLKSDAVDHAHAHDLIGPQDIAWDVAGASVEFGLPAEAREQLRSRVSDAAGRAVDPDLLAFYEVAYLAFQLGAYQMAATGHANWPEERDRLATARHRYARALERDLASA